MIVSISRNQLYSLFSALEEDPNVLFDVDITYVITDVEVDHFKFNTDNGEWSIFKKSAERIVK